MGFLDLFSKGSSAENKSEESSNLPIKKASGGIVESLLIPEPTRSLLWTTDEDTSKIEHAGSITLSISVSDQGVRVDEKQNGFYAEPSLIWTKLPVKPNNELFEEAMYWPSYSQFYPKTRYQYLNWLRDIEQETNLSYVFLYFYCLERHLLVGDYDGAVDEIARLLKSHTKKSFREYASRSLIIASIARNRMDVIDRVPSLLEEEIDEALALRIYKGTSMTPEDIIDIANRVGFNNKRYLKLYPEEFKEELQKQIDIFEDQYGKLLSVFKLEDFKFAESTVFANMSIPEKIRKVKVPVILGSKKFSGGMLKLLQSAHEGVKTRIADGELKRRTPAPRKQQEQLVDTVPVTENEVDEFINKLQENNKNILDLHFAILERIKDLYSKRHIGDNYHKAIVCCKAQIKIQEGAAKEWLSEFPDDTLPMHTGYSQLAVILEKEKRFGEAIDLSKEAKANGWNGDWDKRIERLKAKL
jgi:hypothetical protein